MKVIQIVIMAVLLVCVLWFAYDNCGVNKELAQLEGEYKVHKETHARQINWANKEIERLHAAISEKDAYIEVINEEIEIKNEEIAKLDEDLEELEGQGETIENLKAQLGIWKKKFNLAESIILEKDVIIFTMTEKYDAQVKISDEYLKMYEGERDLRMLLEDRLKLSNKQFKGLKLQNNIKKGIIIGLGAIVIYGLVSK